MYMWHGEAYYLFQLDASANEGTEALGADLSEI